MQAPAQDKVHTIPRCESWSFFLLTYTACRKIIKPPVLYHQSINRELQVYPTTSMTLSQVKKILTDLALTVKVYPLALRVLAEDRGKFYLPEGITTRAHIF